MSPPDVVLTGRRLMLVMLVATVVAMVGHLRATVGPLQIAVGPP